MTKRVSLADELRTIEMAITAAAFLAGEEPAEARAELRHRQATRAVLALTAARVRLVRSVLRKQVGAEVLLAEHNDATDTGPADDPDLLLEVGPRRGRR